MNVVRRRTVLVVAVVVLLVATAAVTYYLSTRVVSPRQAAADADAPTPSELTSQLTSRIVTQSLIASGTVELPSTPLSIAVPDIQNGISVITEPPPAPGSQLTAGQELSAISAQPLFVLPGSVPAYRDLTLGDVGPDVTQLQQGLAAAGFRTGGKGVVDDATVNAVRSLYKRHGAVLAGGAPSSSSADASASPSPLSTNAGVALPRTAFVFAPTLPATVASSAGGLGGAGSTLAVSVQIGQPQLQLDLEPTQAATVHAGVAVNAMVGSTSVSGVVSAVTVAAGTGGATATATCTVQLSGSPSLQAGDTADATLTLSATDGPVLAAPISAVHRLASGQAAIQIIGGDGTRRDVVVDVPVVGDGYAAVSAPGDQLAAGTTVSLQW